MLPIDLYEVKDGQTLNGLVYIQSYIKKLNPESRAPLNGKLHFKGKSLNFKVWDKNLQGILNSNELEGSIIGITGSLGVYNDNLELTVESMKFDHGFEDKTAFQKAADVEALFQEFVTFINTALTPNAVNVVSYIFKEENLYEAFKHEYAGSRMHDAQVGGLMHHTIKMLRLAKVLIASDARLAPYADMLYVGIIFHDIGKVYEMNGGIYTPNSFVTHRTMGVEIVTRYKQAVMDNLGETFFYHILAIQQGHHGEYGDKPTTIWAYLIHLIDMLECNVTGFLDKLETGDISAKNGNTTVYSNGTNLVV